MTSKRAFALHVDADMQRKRENLYTLAELRMQQLGPDNAIWDDGEWIDPAKDHPHPKARGHCQMLTIAFAHAGGMVGEKLADGHGVTPSCRRQSIGSEG